MKGRSAREMAEDVSRARRRNERGALGAVADGLRRSYRWLKLWTVRVLIALVLLAVGVVVGIAAPCFHPRRVSSWSGWWAPSGRLCQTPRGGRRNHLFGRGPMPHSRDAPAAVHALA